MKALTMRATAHPCNAHGWLHYHLEAVVHYEGDVIGHYHGVTESTLSEVAAQIVVMAEDLGVAATIQAHEEFDHSMTPEVGPGQPMGIQKRPEGRA